VSALTAVTDVPISVDTTKAFVARESLAAGAALISDISGFRVDPEMPSVIARAGASAVVMHMRGTPQTMAQDTAYADLFGEIRAALKESVETGRKAGITQIMVDPGIGFGKDAAGNFRLLNGLQEFAGLGCPILVGPSRKAFLGAVLGTPAEDRLEGTIAASVVAAARGARFVRVHDVYAVKRAVRVADAILTAEG
jgi:dihydropteroate synthase